MYVKPMYKLVQKNKSVLTLFASSTKKYFKTHIICIVNIKGLEVNDI